MQKQEEQYLLKQQLREKKEREIELQKEINNKLKNEIKTNTEYKRDEKLKQIQEEARLLKEQKRVNFFIIGLE